MGLFDKVKSKFAKSKDTTDDGGDANDVETSDAAEKVVPGEDSPAE